MSKFIINEWDLSAWIGRFGSMPVEKVLHADYSRSYEIECAHVFKLENGQYAFVRESGCSCYESKDADIELHPNLRLAKAQFLKWEKENKNQS